MIRSNIEYIAEIGWNFMGNLKLAEKMISAAKKSGATSVKFQYWNPDKLKNGPWMQDGRYEIYKKAALSEKKVYQLKMLATKYKLDFLISVFNTEDAYMMKKLKIKKIKIPSHEVYNINLHKFACKNFNKVYVSLGAGTDYEINKAIKVYRNHKNWIPMHCVSSYPCDISRINLIKIKKYLSYSKKVGFSDHTEHFITPSFAIIRGAMVIEKHFTIDNNLPGRDNKFALNPQGFKKMTEFAQLAFESNKLILKSPQASEMDIIKNYRGRWG